MSTKTLEEKILELKSERNAVILAHNYQIGEVQDIADFVGDSLELARRAATTEAEVIVLCGVHFMAETAAILNPDRTVLIPDKNAGCPMACMAAPKQLKAVLENIENPCVVSYVNTTAEIKALSDICCTSSNAQKVVESVDSDKNIIFLPDINLGRYVAECTGRDITLWNGHCPTHARILPEFAEAAKTEHPNAKLCVHPEANPEMWAMADFVGSTAQIIAHCEESDEKEFIIGTEIGILHTLAKKAPNKKFYPVTKVADCPNMKLITLEKIFWSLRDMEDVVIVDEEIATKARVAIDRMMEVTA